MRPLRWLLSFGLLVSTLSVGLALAADAPLTLVLEQHRFTPDTLHVKANAPFVLSITNKDKEEEEFEVSALRIEKMLPAGATLQINIPALKPGTYEFVGEFHEETAKGRIIAE